MNRFVNQCLIILMTVTGLNMGALSLAHAQAGRGTLVETEIAEETVQANLTPVQGGVIAAMPVAVTASFAGQLVMGDWKLGQSIAAGDVLGQLDSTDIAHQISLLEAQQDQTSNRLQEVDANIAFESELTKLAAEQVELLTAKAERAQELARRNAISQEAAETARTALLNAKQQAVTRAKSMSALGFSQSQLRLEQQRTSLQIKKLKQDLADATLTSPIEGQIVSLFPQKQGFARLGDVVATIRAASDYEVEVDIPTRYLPFVSRAETITALTTYGRPVALKLRVVLPEDNQRTGTRAVRLSPAETLPRGLRSVGAPLVIQVPVSAAEPAVTISQDAIVPVTGGHVVFVFDEGVARRQVVTLGSAVGDKMIILSGISANERVIVRGNEGLSDGDTVREGKAPARRVPSGDAAQAEDADQPAEIPTELADDATRWKLVWETRRGTQEAIMVLSSEASLYNDTPVLVTRDGDKVQFAAELVLPFGILTLEFDLTETSDSLSGQVTMLGLPNGREPVMDVTGTKE